MEATRARHILLRVITVIVIVQLAQFFIVDHRYAPRNWAIYRYSTDDVIEIALREDINPQSRYSQLVALAEIAPHSTVYLPTTIPYSQEHRIFGFGRAAELVLIRGTSADLPAQEQAFQEFVVASGPGAHRGPPWFIALDPANGLGGDPADPEGFLAAALAGGQRGSNPGPAREFALLQWQSTEAADPGAEYFDYTSVLIEVTLLTDAQRKRYGITSSGGES